MNLLKGHRLPIIEDCIKALADCHKACALITVNSPHMMRMTSEQVSDYTGHRLARHLAVLLVEDAEITEGIVWSNEPSQFHSEMDTEFRAETVVMKASTYHDLCQALRHLQQEALEDKYRITS